MATFSDEEMGAQRGERPSQSHTAVCEVQARVLARTSDFASETLTAQADTLGATKVSGLKCLALED